MDEPYQQEAYEDDLGLEDADSNVRTLSQRDAVLCVIDCSPSMFDPILNENGVPEHANDHAFNRAMRCVSLMQQTRIINNDSDLMGVLMYNTRAVRHPSNHDGMFVLQTVDYLDADRIRETQRLVDEASAFEEDIGSSASPVAIGQVLWTCSTLFATGAKQVPSKRIFFFTNNDNPHADAPNLRTSALKRAQDLRDLGIVIVPFFMDPQLNRKFDMTAFFAALLRACLVRPLDDAGNIASYEEDEDALSESIASFDTSGRFDDLLARVRKRETNKRPLQKLNLFMGDQYTIGMKAYMLYAEAKKGPHIYLDARTNAETRTVTEWLCKETGSSLMPADIKSAYPYGNDLLPFSKDEMIHLKSFLKPGEKPGLTLLGFKSISLLKPYHNIRTSYFLYPDNQEIPNSVMAFSVLLERMALKGKMAICRLIAREISAPRLVALLPQTETFDENHTQERPPGLCMIPLPFADDIRRVDYGSDPIPEVSEEAIDYAKTLIKKLAMPSYRPEDWENPILQKHYANLQAIALDRDLPDDIVDHTLPQFEKIRKRLLPVLPDFLGAVDFDPSTAPSGAPSARKKAASAGAKAPRKRKAAVNEDDEGEPAEPKPKASRKRKPVEDDEEQDDAPAMDPTEYAKSLASLIQDAGRLKKLTVAELKEHVILSGGQPKRLKAELMEQLVNLVQNKME